MRDEFGIKPMLEHYGCMVDLLGRAELILEAFDFVEEMSLKPNSIIWRTLLGACLNHNHLALAEKARERIIELDPHVNHKPKLFSVFHIIKSHFNLWLPINICRCHV